MASKTRRLERPASPDAAATHQQTQEEALDDDSGLTPSRPSRILSNRRVR
jgi:hypothetical protein